VEGHASTLSRFITTPAAVNKSVAFNAGGRWVLKPEQEEATFTSPYLDFITSSGATGGASLPHAPRM
jgi:hypothetical protein